MSAFEDFVNVELPRRPALLTVTIAGYDGDPNDPGAPAILNGAPLGTYYQQETPGQLWRKNPSGVWGLASGGSGAGGIDIKDEGVSVNLLAKKLDFTGGGVTATQDGVDPDLVNVSIPGGGGSGSTALNLPWKSARFYSGAREQLIRDTNTTKAADKLFAYPIPVPSSTPIDQLAIIVTPANSNPFPGGARVRLALFEDDGGRPGTLIADTEVEFTDTVLTGSSLVLLEGTITERTLNRGFVWFAYIANVETAPDAVRDPVAGVQLGRLGSLAVPGQQRIDELTFVDTPGVSTAPTEILHDVEGNEVSFAWIASVGDSLPAGADVGIVIPETASEAALAFRDAVNNPVTPEQTAVSNVQNNWTISEPPAGSYGVTIEDTTGVQKDFEFVAEGGSPSTPGAFGVEIASTLDEGGAAEALIQLESAASASQSEGTTFRIPDGYNGTEVTFEFEITPGSADPANVAVPINSEASASDVINALQDAINLQNASRADWDVVAAEPTLIDDVVWSMTISLENAGREGNNPIDLTQPVASVWSVSGFEGAVNRFSESATGYAELDSAQTGSQVHGDTVTIPDGNHGTSVVFQFIDIGGTPDPGNVGVEVAGGDSAHTVMNALASAIDDYANAHANWNIIASGVSLVSDTIWRVPLFTQADGTDVNQPITVFSEYVVVSGFSGGTAPAETIDNDQTAQNLVDAIATANAGDVDWNVTAIRSASTAQITAGNSGTIPGGTFISDLNIVTEDYSIIVVTEGSAGVTLPLNITASDQGGDVIRLTWDSEGTLSQELSYLQGGLIVYEVAHIQSGLDPIPASIEQIEPAGVAAAQAYGSMPATFPAVDEFVNNPPAGLLRASGDGDPL